MGKKEAGKGKSASSRPNSLGHQEHHSMIVEDFYFGLDENNTEYVEFYFVTRPGDPMRLLAHAHNQCFFFFFAFSLQYYSPSCSEKHKGSWSKYLDTFVSRIYLLEWEKKSTTIL